MKQLTPWFVQSSILFITLIGSSSYNVKVEEQSKIGYAIGIVNARSGNCVVSDLAIAKEVEVGGSINAFEELTTEMRQKYPVGKEGGNKYESPTKTVVSPGQVVILYSYKTKQAGCESTLIKYSKGKTFDEASKAIEQFKKNCTICFNVSEMKYWPSKN